LVCFVSLPPIREIAAEAAKTRAMSMRVAFAAMGAAAMASAENGIQMITDAHGVPEAPPRYDCSAEYDVWETAWTPDWKAWCCENELRGCPSTSTRTATSSTSTRSTTTRTSTSTETSTSTSTKGLGCDAVCEVAHVNATCGERIRWVTEHDDHDARKPCHAARTLVLSQCSICGGCSMEEAGCESKKEEHKEEKQDRTFMFRKYEVSGQAGSDSAAQARGPLGFFARCSLAGLAAGVPLAVVLRSLRHAGHFRQAELGQQLYEAAVEQGEEVVEATE